MWCAFPTFAVICFTHLHTKKESRAFCRTAYNRNVATTATCTPERSTHHGPSPIRTGPTSIDRRQQITTVGRDAVAANLVLNYNLNAQRSTTVKSFHMHFVRSLPFSLLTSSETAGRPTKNTHSDIGWFFISVNHTQTHTTNRCMCGLCNVPWMRLCSSKQFAHD